MAYRLAQSGDRLVTTHVKRFDARFWTVDFARPMMASVVTTAPDALRVDAVFYQADDLAGLIWEAEDRHDHPLLAYDTDRDFRGCRLSFRWRSAGIRTLDAVAGPTLTIEGRDAAGNPRAWYVRLWNYAAGDPDDAVITLDFDALDGGFLLPGEADPVWAGDIDRMFISLIAPGYTGVAMPLAAPAEGWVELSAIRCDGSRSVLAIGDAMVPAHGLRIATGYDDCYHLTPARVMRMILALGYRGIINHYVGMSHYFRLERVGDAWLAGLDGGALNRPAAVWHEGFAALCHELDYRLILSLSYELFDAHAPEEWKQRAADGAPALTGWVPPSTLLSPASAEAMAYLQAVARAFVAIAVAAGLEPIFQIGEPWWWVMPDGRPCLYDAAARAALGGDPPEIASVRGPLSPSETTLLAQAGALLAASTAGLRDAARADAPGCTVALLVYLPTVLDAAAPELRRANVPIGWASPAYDILQLEDYDWVTEGRAGATARGIAAATVRLGYPVGEQHYFAGFILNREAAPLWARIEDAAAAGRARGSAQTFIWALPQVARDGFTHFETGETAVQAFDDVSFPIAIGARATVEPGFSTAVVTSAGGHEQRNADWASARLRFDAGPGVRSEADIGTLIGFFRARMGAARGFRFRDPFDDSSNGMTGAPEPFDQQLGTGDGTRTRFALVKRYGAGDVPARAITRPVALSVRIAVGGIERLTGWTVEPGGAIEFVEPPSAGAAVTAGYRFDVPVRFAEDRLEIARANWAAGEAVSVPLIEIREPGA